MTYPYSLPETWVWSSLGDICKIVPQINPKQAPNNTFSYIDISSIDNTKYTITEPKIFLGKDAPSRARKPVQSFDIIFGTVRPYLRNIAIISPEYDGALCSTAFCVLRTFDEVDYRYLFHYVRSDGFIARISEKQRGVSYPAVTENDIREELIPIPPYSEQLQIVKILESFSENRNSLADAIQLSRQRIQHSRTSILNKAFKGELTWNADFDEFAQVTVDKAMLQRRQIWENLLVLGGDTIKEYKKPDYDSSSTESLPDLPNGWTWISLDNIAKYERNSLIDGPFGSNLKTSDYVEMGVRVIRLQNIGVAEFKGENKVYISQEKYSDLQKYEVQPGDVIIAALAEPVGRACLAPSNIGKSIVKADCIKLRVDDKIAINKYIMYALNSPEQLERAKNVAHGVGRERVNLGNIKSFFIPLAPISLQRLIVEYIDTLFNRALEFETELSQAAQALQSADQSTLESAFRGLLHIDRAEEDASHLLARISIAREQESLTKITPTLEVSMPATQKSITPISSPEELTILLQKLCDTTNDKVLARSLWLESHLEIEDFYVFLKQELGKGKINESDSIIGSVLEVVK